MLFTIVFLGLFLNVFLFSDPSLSQQESQTVEREEIWVEDPPEIILAEDITKEQSGGSGLFDLSNQEKVTVVSSGLWILAGLLLVLLIIYIRSTSRKGKTIST